MYKRDSDFKKNRNQTEDGINDRITLTDCTKVTRKGIKS